MSGAMRFVGAVVFIKNLISDYVDQKRVAELDALQQYSSILIEEHYIVESLKLRYGTAEAYRSALNELYKTGLSRHEASEVLDFFIRMLCSGLFKEEIKKRVKSFSDDYKEVIALFVNLRMLTSTPHDYREFCNALSKALGISTDDVRKAMVKSGLVNEYWYRSKRFSHPAWQEAPWTSDLVLDMSRNRHQYGLPDCLNRLPEVLENDVARDILQWAVEQLKPNIKGYISFDEYERKKEEVDARVGKGSFERELNNLVGSGGLIIASSDARFGYYFCIHPNAVCLMAGDV